MIITRHSLCLSRRDYFSGAVVDYSLKVARLGVGRGAALAPSGLGDEKYIPGFCHPVL